ncbi:hypothetical protein T492DRAFT_831945 [Pavlovales sp. CCMP2436]|nr:hypothetical protein T492DRAFT_831945 [Pavlovales sp. CCMP2436]
MSAAVELRGRHPQVTCVGQLLGELAVAQQKANQGRIRRDLFEKGFPSRSRKAITCKFADLVVRVGWGWGGGGGGVEAGSGSRGGGIRGGGQRALTSSGVPPAPGFKKVISTVPLTSGRLSAYVHRSSSPSAAAAAAHAALDAPLPPLPPAEADS